LLHHHESAAAVALRWHAVLLLLQLVRVWNVTHFKLHGFSAKVLLLLLLLLLLLQARGEPRLEFHVRVVHESGCWRGQVT
jgi:hypothetical protein